jgi:transglutaminase-like putative cysteine protease
MNPGSLKIVMHRPRLATLLAACAVNAVNAITPAFAADTMEAAQPSTLVSDVHVFVVADDGSLTEDDETTLRANTSWGVGDIAQRYIWFDKTTSTVDIAEAYSISADGIRHEVAPDQIREMQEPRSAGAPTFADGRLKAIIFPAVGAGSIVHLRFHKTVAKSVIPGQFDYFVEPSRSPVQSQKLIFDLPASKPLYADARGYIAVPPVTRGGRTRYEFAYSRTDYDRLEAGAVGYVQYGDRLMVSTFPDYSSFAASYRDGAIDPTLNDPAIRNLAESLTHGMNDPREKAATLYDWVRHNIRYVSLYLDQSPAVPHKATDILANRYGDCKDYVALYGALLTAVGVDNEPALIGLGSVYTLPSVPGYGAAAINHIITWLPGLGVFADATATSVEFGYLSLAEMDRPALLVGNGTLTDGTLTRTPATQPLSRTARLQIDVAPDGSASFASHVEDGGWSAGPERATLQRASPERRKQIADTRLRASGLRGTANLTASGLNAVGTPVTTTLRGSLDDLVWPTGTTALPALTSLSGGIATRVETLLAERVRTQPFVCESGSFDEVSQIGFPRTVHVTDVPADTNIADTFFTYSSRYVFDPAANGLQIERHWRANFGKQVCSPAEFTAMQTALKRIERDTKAQIVVKIKIERAG